jgi:PAS domain S-box-containing protein
LELQNVDLRQAQIEVEKLKDRYLDLYDYAPVGYLTLNDKGLILEANLTAVRLLGVERKSLTKIFLYQFICEEFMDTFYLYLQQVFQSQSQQTCEIKLTRKDGTVFHAQLESIAVPDESGHYIRCRTILSDITDRKLAEEAQSLLSTAIEHAAEGVIITDPTGIIQYVNPAEETITGYNHDELIGQTPNIFKSDKHGDNLYRKLWETINGGNVWSGRFINKKKDGTEYHEDASISPVYDKTGNLTNFVAVKHDVTKQLELQDQLLQAQKMEAVGTLTGGLAHDFNNLLQIILSNLDAILSNPALPEKIRKNLNDIDRAGTRGAELVKKMLVYGRKVPFKFQPVDLNNLVAQTKSLLAGTIPSTIKIDFLMDNDLLAMNADPNQIEQVLINLAINARDAMPHGGGLTIETRNTLLDEEFCRSYPDIKPGRYVLLSVTDTGTGMDTETVKRVFEPFFTTKKPGKGSGLGLSVVYGILEKHGGKIICLSDPFVGTTFRVYFPAIEEVHEETIF